MISRNLNPRARRRSKVFNRQRRFPLRAAELAAFADTVLDYLKQPDQEVAIMLVRDQAIRYYNARFLDHDGPTDVISFPYDGSAGDGFTDLTQAAYLGDIIISVDTADANARRYRLSLEREVKNLVIHGIVHLLGYDHTADQGQMRALERRVRQALL